MNSIKSKSGLQPIRERIDASLSRRGSSPADRCPSFVVRRSSVARGRRGFHPGQSVVLALAVMFLMIFMGALFVTMIARNLTRVDRATDTSQAQQLAEAGLRYADQQLTFSDEGADWRPQLNQTFNLKPGADPRDPDYFWLTDNGSFKNPFVRFASGEGRFLLRVTYEPTYRASAPNVTVPDEFDSLSGYIHVEVIGRPGKFSGNDPTELINTTNNPNWEPGQILGAHRKIDAWKPIGLMDQLWWVTNLKKSRGPAQFGVARYEDGNGKSVQFRSDYRGSVRSNVDLTYVGDTRFQIRPGFGEGVYVAGETRFQRAGNNVPLVNVQVLANDGTVTQTYPEGETGSTAFNPIINQITRRGHYLDNLALADPSQADSARSIRLLEAPRLDAEDPSGGVQRYRRLTRESGEMRRVTNPQSGDERDVNLGVYGYGAGLYIDNFDDIQYPNDRDAVVNEWLQRGVGDVALTGWVGATYTPSVRQQGGARPIMEMVFTENEAGEPRIRITRTDRDTENRNFGSNKGGTRIFYAWDPANPGVLDDLGTTAEFKYPANGILYTEGSVRVRGRVGSSGNGKTLQVVSGGTIYIEGNLLKGDPTSRLALFARDYVTMNPTKLTAIIPGDEVQVEGDQTGTDVRSFHYSVPQNSYVDLQMANSVPIPANGGLLLSLQHSGGFQDSNSRTDLALYINGLAQTDRYDFAGSPPPYPPSATGSQSVTPYQFFFFPPSVQQSLWHQSNAQSIQGSSINYERKAFYIPSSRLNVGANEVNNFRVHVEPTPGGQPYWLSRVVAVPYQQSLEARIEAVMYAQNGSWFVIPGPWFNEDPRDSRELFANGDTAAGRTVGLRGPNTFPSDTEDFPFYHEPPNVKILVRGSIAENMPVPATERVQWVKKLFVDKSANSITTSWYEPSISYEYDDDFRKWVRWRNVVTGQEGIAYLAPDTPAGVTDANRLATIQAAALQAGQNILTLPLFPRLPTGGLIYHGTPG